MRIGVLNQLQGEIKTIQEGAVTARVKVKLDNGVTLFAVISMTSLKKMGLNPNEDVTVMFSAFDVALANRTFPENNLHGTITEVNGGANTDQVSIETDNGIKITSLSTHALCEKLALAAGNDVYASVRPYDVFLGR